MIEGVLTLLKFFFKKGQFFYVPSPPDSPVYVAAFKRKTKVKDKFPEYEKNLGDYKGLWYQVHGEAIEFTNYFYEENKIYLGKAAGYLNKIFKTNKFEAFIKKRILENVFGVLKILYLAKNCDKDSVLLLRSSKLNSYIVKRFKQTRFNNVRTEFFYMPSDILIFFGYGVWLMKEFIKRGIRWNRQRCRFKLSVEARCGFGDEVLRDDLLIDGKYFTAGDILFYQLNRAYRKDVASCAARQRGFHIIALDDLAVNFNKNNFLEILYLYFYLPFILSAKLMFLKQAYLLYGVLRFFIQAFAVEILMGGYEIGCNVSYIDNDDIARTIAFNRHGTKNAIFHWSDLTVFKASMYAFVAHNLYFMWGDLHYDYHADNFFVDRRINVGCIYKNEFSKAAKNRQGIIENIAGFRKEKKAVTFFDTSFIRNYSWLVETFFIEYLAVVKEFCEKNKDVNVLFKPKNRRDYEGCISGANLEHFREIWAQLCTNRNFIFLDAGLGIGKVIAVSDVCINMGINSPASVALICRKDALYFDKTDNQQHYFAKNYKNTLVFDDKNLLFSQIDNILSGRFRCRDVVSEEEIRKYDAFDDDKALDRLRHSLYEVTSINS